MYNEQIVIDRIEQSMFLRQCQRKQAASRSNTSSYHSQIQSQTPSHSNSKIPKIDQIHSSMIYWHNINVINYQMMHYNQMNITMHSI